ncbi:malate dehydrogenase [Pyrenophora seminiperda CCB06]|uniref:Malate dehydrogenase n=1 Tax=Pyrenophora seminiperda CCB06 TaxID=1302712 RepID=A0A3M7M6J7_9PLEO|nr:malate dehydrogenase [Pyrenophora seminiperda CCB06]
MGDVRRPAEEALTLKIRKTSAAFLHRNPRPVQPTSCTSNTVIMFAARQAFSQAQRRCFSASASQNSKVTVLGAAGGIGQPLSLLLKLNPRVSQLSLYDIRLAPGVAADIGHINTKSELASKHALMDKKVIGHDATPSGLAAALKGADIVVIPAGVPRKPGMTRDDLFNTNASIVRDLAKAAADHSPDANILIISNPVNSTVPITAEVFKSKGVYNPKRLFGVTTLDVVRASRFISQLKGTDPAHENITVIGGHSGATIVPLLSQSGFSLHGDQLKEYIRRVQFGGDEVVKAKDGAGSATLSMAMAGARFAESLLKAAQGEKNVIEPTFVDSPLFKDQGCEYFSTNVELGPNGVEKIHPVGKISEFEQELLDTCVADLAGNIKKGVEWVKANP